MAKIFWKGINEYDCSIAHKKLDIYEVKPNGVEVFLKRVLLYADGKEVITEIPDNILYTCYEIQKNIVYLGKTVRGEYHIKILFKN